MGCTEDEPLIGQEYDYVIFGHFYGFCVGEECVEIFKLENETLFEDSLDNYPSNEVPYQGDYVELTEDLYNLVSDIPMLIPGELLNITKSRIGCPDCTDGGGIFIQIKIGDEVRYWLIDQFLSNVPEELHNFINTINNRISLLQ